MSEAPPVYELTQGEKKSVNSEFWRFLQERPRTWPELKEAGLLPGYENRRFVEKIKVGGGTEGSIKSRGGHWITVLYLYGDGRRGMRRFYEENRDRIEDCLTDHSSVLNHHLDEYQLRLLYEERRFAKVADVGAEEGGD